MRSRTLTDVQQKILEVLEGMSDPVPGPKLADAVDIEYKRLGFEITKIRQMFVNDVPESKYVYLNPHGYTLRESADSVSYEANRRMRMGTSIINNGEFIFSRCRRRSRRRFDAIKVEFFGKLEQTMKLMSVKGV